MTDDRKYGHRGYMESDKSSGGRRSPGPPPPRPEGPRGRGADVAKAVVFACRACGNKRRDPEEIGTEATCPKCGGDLHACAQCSHFDTAARFECTQPIPARIPLKKARNVCPLYTPALSFDLSGERPVATPDDARAAFDRLFRK